MIHKDLKRQIKKEFRDGKRFLWLVVFPVIMLFFHTISPMKKMQKKRIKRNVHNFDKYKVNKELIFACKKGDFSRVKELIDKHVCKAAEIGDEQTLKYLYKQGADITAIDENGRSLLQIAQDNDADLGVIQFLAYGFISIERDVK